MKNSYRKICVVGLGYIGLPLACTLAKLKYKVYGVDIKEEVVSLLKLGKSHIEEKGLPSLLQQVINSNNLEVKIKPVHADCYIITVPTPNLESKNADLSFIKNALKSIIPFLKKGNLIILESTVPPGTTVDFVLPILSNAGFNVGVDIYLAYSPERILPGNMLHELVHNPRTVGGINTASTKAAFDVYNIFVKGKITLTDSTTAEMVKLMENTYRDINIAIANEFSRICQKNGVDIYSAIKLANQHPRVDILNPGPGVGGHCISVDPWFLINSAPEESILSKKARNINDSQPNFIIELVKKKMGPLNNFKIGILGLAYKADVGDFRESPSLEIINILKKQCSLINSYDPFSRKESIKGIKRFDTINEALKDVDIIIFLVPHKFFKKITPKELEKITPARYIFDFCKTFNRREWADSKFSYSSFHDA